MNCSDMSDPPMAASSKASVATCHYIKIFNVCLSRKEFDPEPKVAASLGHWRLEATARMPLCTLGKALTTGKTTSEINVTDMNEIRVDTYFSWGPESVAA